MNKKSNQKKKSSGETPVKYIKYGFIGFIAVLVLVIAFAIYYYLSTDYVASVQNGKVSEKVSRAEFNFFLKNVQSQFLAGAGDVDPKTFWNTRIGTELAIDIAKKQALDLLKELKVQLIKAKQANISLEKGDLDYVDGIIGQIVTQYGNGSRPKASEYTRQNLGVTIDEFRDIYREISLTNKLKEKETAGIKVSENEVRGYYDKNTDVFKGSAQFRKDAEEAVWARHILIKTIDENQKELPADRLEEAKKKAEGLLARAKNGEDFAKLARGNSEDPGSASYGGDYVFGKGKMMPEFEKAAFELSPGQVSGMVKTKYGYHIIKLEEKISKDQPVSYRCAKEYREFSLSERTVINTIYQQKLGNWKKEYEIKINKLVYDAIKE